MTEEKHKEPTSEFQACVMAHVPLSHRERAWEAVDNLLALTRQETLTECAEVARNHWDGFQDRPASQHFESIVGAVEAAGRDIADDILALKDT